jgi:hypothetical protein
MTRYGKSLVTLLDGPKEMSYYRNTTRVVKFKTKTGFEHNWTFLFDNMTNFLVYGIGTKHNFSEEAMRQIFQKFITYIPEYKLVDTNLNYSSDFCPVKGIDCAAETKRNVNVDKYFNIVYIGPLFGILALILIVVLANLSTNPL